ncbi:Alpha/beta_hydrolase family protein [Hexamita inflata]|uniref:Alpha/beta hydrolase family protein n=1 Tax=Hexamita inflata TaxID=28002 RepID=A0AA86TPK8_9EUKA|nr:Alpha/beta hydrolase family protein [Hexamita inflata]
MSINDQMIYDRYNIEHVPLVKFNLNPESFHTIDFNGKKLNTYIDGPENGQKLFFIHGFDMFVEMYSTFINELILTYRVLSVDLPGHGQTDAFDDYQVSIFQDSIITTLDHYDFKDFTLVGHSMGGMLSIICTGDTNFTKFNISSTIAFCPAGIKMTESFFGPKKSLCCASPSPSPDQRRGLFPSDFDSILSKLKQSKQNPKYIERRQLMISDFPWEKSQKQFIQAKDKKVLVFLADDEQYVNTKRTLKFVQQKCKKWSAKVEKGLHELPILRPKWAAEQINGFVK